MRGGEGEEGGGKEGGMGRRGGGAGPVALHHPAFWQFKGTALDLPGVPPRAAWTLGHCLASMLLLKGCASKIDRCQHNTPSH